MHHHHKSHVQKDDTVASEEAPADAETAPVAPADAEQTPAVSADAVGDKSEEELSTDGEPTEAVKK